MRVSPGIFSVSQRSSAMIGTVRSDRVIESIQAYIASPDPSARPARNG
jgi:hypothetical protein